MWWLGLIKVDRGKCLPVSPDARTLVISSLIMNKHLASQMNLLPKRLPCIAAVFSFSKAPFDSLEEVEVSLLFGVSRIIQKGSSD